MLDEEKEDFTNPAAFTVPESFLDKMFEFTGNGEDGGFILAYVNQEGKAMIQCKISSQIIEMGLRKAVEQYLEQSEQTDIDSSIGPVDE